MAAVKTRSAREVQNDTRNFRTARGSFEWGGMIPDGDPGSLPPNRPRKLWNTRRVGGLIVPRGGQEAFIDLDQAVRGLFDFQMGTKRKLMIVGDGCPDISSAVGFYIGSKDIEQLPQVQQGVYYNSATQAVLLSRYADDLYIAEDVRLRKYQTIDAPYGVNGLSLSGSSQDIPIYAVAAPFTKISAIRDYPFSGLLFFAGDAGAGASSIFSWDGLTIRSDLASIDAPTGFGLYRELLIAGFAAATNRIKTRDISGAWTTVGPPLSGACAFKEGISYKDVFYWTTLGEDVFKFDGTTITRIPILTTGFPANSVTYGIEVFNGYLYVSYTTAAGSARIARFDGTTWLPTHKVLTAQVAAASAARPIRSYRGSLIAGVQEATVGTIYTSPLTDTAGAWVRSNPNDSANQGSINQLLVY